jgi:hypothetical protein
MPNAQCKKKSHSAFGILHYGQRGPRSSAGSQPSEVALALLQFHGPVLIVIDDAKLTL